MVWYVRDLSRLTMQEGFRGREGFKKGEGASPPPDDPCARGYFLSQSASRTAPGDMGRLVILTPTAL